MDKRSFSTNLLGWWRENRRDFPWRRTRDPYQILVAEILLHRTRAAQVTPVYQRLIQRYPTVRSLAAADGKELQAIAKPLGLYWRTDLLIEVAKSIVDRGGRVPRRPADLESLPGVGPYISSAVRCFAYEYSDLVIDTNTVRVVSRLFGVISTANTRRSKTFIQLANTLRSDRHPRETNFALLDLAALICRPVSPKCRECPVADHCEYARARIVGP